MPAPCTKIERYLATCTGTYWYICGISGKWWKPWKWKLKWCEGTYPYPCCKTRKVNGTGYTCSYIRMKCWLLFCYSYCCENGIEYGRWKGPAFKVGEHFNMAGGSFCFKDALEETGACKQDIGDIPSRRIPSGEGTVSAPNPDPESTIKMVGLGDIVKAVTMKLGIKPCEDCRKRAIFLNQHFPIGFYKNNSA